MTIRHQVDLSSFRSLHCSPFFPSSHCDKVLHPSSLLASFPPSRHVSSFPLSSLSALLHRELVDQLYHLARSIRPTPSSHSLRSSNQLNLFSLAPLAPLAELSSPARSARMLGITYLLPHLTPNLTQPSFSILTFSFQSTISKHFDTLGVFCH
jgi:hypothetical protein